MPELVLSEADQAAIHGLLATGPAPRGAAAQAAALAHLAQLVGDGPAPDCGLVLDVRRPRLDDRQERLLAMLMPALRHLLAEREPAPSECLTTQERRVLREVAAGRTNREAAELLCIAPSTVRKHLEHAYRKLGVTSRYGAMVAMREDGPTRSSA